MNLFIDSTNNLKTLIRLDDTEYLKEYSSPRDQDILAYLLEVLEKSHHTIKDITSIEVNPGPGSFTGCRLGVAIGNALAYALGLKINGQVPPILPIYPAETTWKVSQ